MASISAFLQKIMSAVYGEEVRGSIHDAIKAMNEESSNAMQYASTAKDSAQASAASAQEAADSIAQKANEAAASAASAETAKEAAQAAQEAAVINEANAQNFAKAALASVSATEAARDDAIMAKTAAETARAAAETAQSDAEKSKIVSETARDAAAESAASAQQYSGKPPKPLDGTWWIWNAEKQIYVDSKIGCELVGPPGTSIEDIQLSSGSHSPGTTDIYTVKLTDGTTYNISVYNGRNGTGAGDVMGIWFDLVIPASGWSNGEITIADNRLLALATHKYFLSAEKTCRDEFLDCNIQSRDITETGFITFTSDKAPAMDLTVNLIRLELTASGTA